MNEKIREQKYPIVQHMPCGCVVNIWEETIRTDFCKFHAEQNRK